MNDHYGDAEKTEDRDTLKRIELLLGRGLLYHYEDGTKNPHKRSLLFFETVPAILLDARLDYVRASRGLRWFLVTAEDGGPEWEESLAEVYRVSVVFVDDLAAAKQRLLGKKDAT